MYGPFDPYENPTGRLLRFVCENPHAAKDILAAMNFLNPQEILDQLCSEVASDELTPF